MAAVPGVQRVDCVTTADELLSRYARQSADVLFVGTQRAVTSGAEATRRLMAAHPRATVVVLGAPDDARSIAAAITGGARGYLRWDAARPELVAARIAEVRAAGVTVAASLSPPRTQQLAKVVVDAGVDIMVIRGTTVSAEHVSGRAEPLNLKQFIYELDVPVIVGGCATYQAALHLMRTGAAGVLVGFGGGEVHLVQDGDDLVLGVQGLVDVGQGLGFHALGGIYDEEAAFAGGEAAADFIGEIDMPRRVHQVELVGQAVMRLVGEADGLRLDSDAALLLQVHVVENLAGHLAVRQPAAGLDQAVGQGALAVVDVGDDGEVADEVERGVGHGWRCKRLRVKSQLSRL
jgi:CheY-like chemotaxis protein